MDYRAAARYRATRLSDLMSEETLSSGKGLIKSSAKAISAKTKAGFKGIQQTLDPLNIASAMMGRSRLGTTVAGKMFGRSAEDIDYFSGDRGRSARPIKKYRYKNPLVSSVGSGDTQPAKRNDGVANIFGKIYNTMMKNREEEKKRKEIENNFKEERLEEDKRRHKELIDAISKGRGSKIQKVEKKDDGGGIFGLLKGLFDKILEFVAPVVSFFKAFLKPLEWLFEFFVKIGKGALKILTSIFSGAKALVMFLGEELMAFVKKLFPSLFPKAPTEVSSKGKTTKTPQVRDAKTGKFVKAAAKESKILKGAKGTLNFLKKIPGLSLIAAGATLIYDVNNAIKQNEAGKITDTQMKKTIVGSVGGALGGVGGGEIGAMIGGALGSVVPVVGTLIGGVAGGVGGFLLGESVGKEIAEKSFDYFVGNPDAEPKVSKATPVAKETQSTPISAKSPATAGASGATGATGSSGSSGAAGSSGSAGAVGPAGTSGSVGPVGSAGAAGSSGSPGAAGSAGAMGSSGAAGSGGSAGAIGSSGAAGAAGSSSTQMASPMSPKPSPVAAASAENSNLQIEEKSMTKSSSPVVVNNTSSTGIEAKKNDGVPPVPAAVRNLDLDDSLIKNLMRVVYQ